MTRVICPVGVLLGFCNKSLQALVWHFKRASLTLTIISRKKQKSEKKCQLTQLSVKEHFSVPKQFDEFSWLKRTKIGVIIAILSGRKSLLHLCKSMFPYHIISMLFNSPLVHNTVYANSICIHWVCGWCKIRSEKTPNGNNDNNKLFYILLCGNGVIEVEFPP